MHIPSRSAPPATSRPHPAVWPLRLLFSAEAVSFALILPRIPDIKLDLNLSEAELGVALLGIPAGTLIGLLAAPSTVRKAGVRRAAWLSVAALAWTFVLPGLAWSQLGLFAAFFVCGIAVSHTEIALGSLASRVEAMTATRIMSQCHGFWSIGSIGGVVVGGTLAQLGTPVAVQAFWAGVALTACVLALARPLPSPPDAAAPARTTFALPSPALIPLCLLPVATMIIEGIFMDWSAIHLRLSIGTDPFGASLGFAALAIAMAVVRLSGDWLIGRFGERRVVFLSNVATGAGTLIFALAPTLDVALVGAALGGAGIAVVYPTALSAAARAPGSPERNIAAVSFTSFFILLGSPAAFGLLSQTVGLRASFALCAALVLPALALVRGLATKASATSWRPRAPLQRPAPDDS